MVTAIEHPDRADVTAALAQLVELGGTDFATEMVELLHMQTPEQFAMIDAGLSSGDLAVAQRQAHSMKSSFGNFGARECQRIATAMDLAGKKGQAKEFDIYYVQLRHAFDRLMMVLDDLAR